MSSANRQARPDPDAPKDAARPSHITPVEDRPAADAAPDTAPKGDDAPPKGNRKRVILGAVALAVLAGGGYEGWHYWTVGRWQVETDDAYVSADIAIVSSRVQGYVDSLEADENQHVTKGQVLVRLDDGDYRIALDTANSRVDSAAQTLARIDAQIEAARAAVTQAEAGLDAAEAQSRTADTTADRIRKLAGTNVVSQAQLDTATEGQDTARASVAQARAAVASAQAQVAVLKAQKAEAEGTRHELELAAAQAQRNLDMTVLRAPADGVLGNMALEVGDLVTPGSRLAALVPDAGLYIEANYKETQMEGIAQGAPVHVTFDALPDREFQGTVASIAPATGSVFSLLPADNATGNFTKVVQRVPVRIELPQAALDTGALRAGLSAIVSVDRHAAEDGAGHGTATQSAALAAE